ncbi:MAG TPA: prolyl oligopeptidase family serine peptidase [Candidatus Angelobacter sp.]|jgi:dipeptidyl aminopeptidase/acylaminoacyl peptidase
MKTIQNILKVLLCFLSLALFAPAQDRQTPLDIRTALDTRSLAAPISLAPTGDWVAYCVTEGLKRVPPNGPRDQYYTPSGAIREVVGSNLWITNLRTGKTKNLTKDMGTNWGPVWSPDGAHLAFYSDRSGTAHLWVWDKDTGNIRQVSDAIVRPFFNFQVVRWTPDSRKILVKVLPEKMSLAQASGFVAGHFSAGQQTGLKAEQKSEHGATAVVYSFSPAKENLPTTMEVPEWSKWYFTDLALIDAHSGEIQRIARGQNVVGYWISPDGKFAAYTLYKARKTNTQRQLYDLLLLSILDGSSRTVAADLDMGDGIAVSWSPDSHSLAYLGSSNGISGSDCFVVSVSEGTPQNIAASAHPPFGYSYRAPLWDADGKYLYFISSGVSIIGQPASSDIWRVRVAEGTLSKVATVPGKSIIEVVSPLSGGRFWSPGPGNSITVRTRDEETKQAGFYRVDLTTGSATKLIENDSNIGFDSIFLTDVSADGKALVYAYEDASHPMEIWSSGPTLLDSHTLTNMNPQLAGTELGKSRLVSWHSLDGQPLQGVILLPSGYKKGVRYPLIVNVYGGAYASDEINKFGLAEEAGDNLQILATRGYAVFLPDSPQGKQTPMADLAKTILPGIEKLVEMGIADTNRIGVMGASYGGYSTLALIVQSTRFKAAVAGAPPTDLISNYGTMDATGTNQTIGWSEKGQGKMLGTPWENRDRYIENSPIFYLDRIQTPLLLVHGELDLVVSPRQSEEVFIGLRRLRKEVVYVRYAGEDHWPGGWSPPNVIDYWNRVVQWFDGHLSPDQKAQ